MSLLPTPSSSWVVGLGGAVYEVKPDGKKVSARAGKPLIGRTRAKGVCSACRRKGHNSSNKKCPNYEKGNSHEEDQEKQP